MNERKEIRIIGIIAVLAVLLAVVAVFIYMEAKTAREKRAAAGNDGETSIGAVEEKTSWIVNRESDPDTTQDYPLGNTEPESEFQSGINLPYQLFQNDEELKQRVMSGYIEELWMATEAGILILPEDAVFLEWEVESGDITYQTGEEIIKLYYKEGYRNVY